MRACRQSLAGPQQQLHHLPCQLAAHFWHRPRLLLCRQEDATTRQRQEALYGSTAVHATFGDVELAQITLRGADMLRGQCRDAAAHKQHVHVRAPAEAGSRASNDAAALARRCCPSLPTSSLPPCVPAHACCVSAAAEAIKAGLDFEQALVDPDMVELVTSPQVCAAVRIVFCCMRATTFAADACACVRACVCMQGARRSVDACNPPLLRLRCMQILIQLKRFNQTAQQAVAARARSRPPIGGSRAKTRPGASGSPLEQDLGSILGTPDSDTAAIDTSVGGA